MTRFLFMMQNRYWTTCHWIHVTLVKKRFLYFNRVQNNRQRTESATPSFLSMKSDHSTDYPLNFSDEPAGPSDPQ